MADAELLFAWKNDKETIENSITKRGVTMEEHLNWLQGVIKNLNRHLFILDVDGVSVGQMRLDLNVMLTSGEKETGDKDVDANRMENSSITAEISYGLGAEHRGKGLGKVLLEQAEDLANELQITELTAEVLPHNVPSQKLFQKLGYTEERKEGLLVYKKRIK